VQFIVVILGSLRRPGRQRVGECLDAYPPTAFLVRCHIGKSEVSAMDTPESGPPSPPTPASSLLFRDVITDAIRYWEARRVGYNLVLAAIVLSWVTLTWQHFRGAFSWPSVLAVFVLAVLANVCYCAAYLVDVPLQYSAFQDSWRRRRWALWLLGVIFAGVITFYWIADEIYPSVA
jgi:hypothetical protein